MLFIKIHSRLCRYIPLPSCKLEQLFMCLFLLRHMDKQFFVCLSCCTFTLKYYTVFVMFRNHCVKEISEILVGALNYTAVYFANDDVTGKVLTVWPVLLKECQNVYRNVRHYDNVSSLVKYNNEQKIVHAVVTSDLYILKIILKSTLFLIRTLLIFIGSTTSIQEDIFFMEWGFVEVVVHSPTQSLTLLQFRDAMPSTLWVSGEILHPINLNVLVLKEKFLASAFHSWVNVVFPFMFVSITFWKLNTRKIV